MDRSRGAVYTVVALIVATTVVSGPLVGAVDFTHERTPTFGRGTATVTVVEMPDSATVEGGRFGEESYYVRVAPATVTVDSVDGHPFLVYKLTIATMGYGRSSLYTLAPEKTGTMKLSLEEDALNPEKVPEPGEYDGSLSILLRSGHNETVVERRNITVVVRQ